MELTILSTILALAVAALGFFYLRLLKENHRIQREHDVLKVQNEVEKTAWQKAEEQFKDTFKSLATTALEGNSAQFMQLAQASLKQQGQTHEHQLTQVVSPLKEALERYQTQILTEEKGRERILATLDQELKHLTKTTTALKDALKKPHVRGRWGEIQLKNCVEMAGLAEHVDFQLQQHTNDEAGASLYPDMTVKMPGGRSVVVDAKTPLDAFISAIEATTEDQRNIEMTRHGRHVKDHVKRLSQKSYYEHLPDAVDFTVMFLPNESFLYAALENEPDLVEFALQRKVLIATPPTFIGLLKVIRMGWNEQRLADNAKKISELGQELHKRICDFVDSYTLVGKHLEKANEEYNKGKARLESRVITQARRFETLGAKSHKSLGESNLLESNDEGTTL